MSSKYNFQKTSTEDLSLRQLELQLELVAIDAELEARTTNKHPLNCKDSRKKPLFVGDKVTLLTKSKKGTAFENIDEGIVVGWNATRTDIVIRKIANDGFTTTRRPYYLRK